jgi:hypothetical protein
MFHVVIDIKRKKKELASKCTQRNATKYGNAIAHTCNDNNNAKQK